MADEWRPVVGGRAMLGDDAVTVLSRSPVGDRTWVAPHTWEGSIVSCATSDLREHPDDRRARRLLEAAREVDESHKVLIESMPGTSERRAVARHHAAHEALRAIVAEIDHAEADHAS